jgi:hypothetical protein
MASPPPPVSTLCSHLLTEFAPSPLQPEQRASERSVIRNVDRPAVCSNVYPVALARVLRARCWCCCLNARTTVTQATEPKKIVSARVYAGVVLARAQLPQSNCSTGIHRYRYRSIYSSLLVIVASTRCNSICSRRKAASSSSAHADGVATSMM